MGAHPLTPATPLLARPWLPKGPWVPMPRRGPPSYSLLYQPCHAVVVVTAIRDPSRLPSVSSVPPCAPLPAYYCCRRHRPAPPGGAPIVPPLLPMYSPYPCRSLCSSHLLAALHALTTTYHTSQLHNERNALASLPQCLALAPLSTPLALSDPFLQPSAPLGRNETRAPLCTQPPPSTAHSSSA